MGRGSYVVTELEATSLSGKSTRFHTHPSSNFCDLCRSRSGIVNLYGSDATSSSSHVRPKPLKAIGNLTTSITSARFNHDSQLLAIASNVKKDQMRLVCLPGFFFFLVLLLLLAYHRPSVALLAQLTCSCERDTNLTIVAVDPSSKHDSVFKLANVEHTIGTSHER